MILLKLTRCTIQHILSSIDVVSTQKVVPEELDKIKSELSKVKILTRKSLTK